MDQSLRIKKKIDFRSFIKLGLSLIALVLTLSILSPLEAQNFPNRPVTMVVPFTPGSGVDLTARAIQPYAEKALGVSIVIDNVPGADSRIGTAKIYKANPNGYTIGIHGFPVPIIHQYLFDVSYKPLDFSFIYAWALAPMLLFVSEDNWKNFDDFLLDAKKRPMSIGVAGYGSVVHVLAMAAAKKMNLKFKYIPFSGSKEGFTALAGKHIDANIGSTDAALGMVQGKLVRPILVWSFHPEPNFPDVPLSTTYNLPTVVQMRGVFGPPKIPEDRVQVLEKAFSQAAADPKVVEWAKTRGVDLVSLNAKQFQQEVEKQQAVVKEYKDLLVKTP